MEELHLPVEKLDFGAAKPTITFDPADCGFSELVGPARSCNLRLERQSIYSSELVRYMRARTCSLKPWHMVGKVTSLKPASKA